jgi:hypothetical protein
VCCLLVLNLVSSTLSCIRQPRPRLELSTNKQHTLTLRKAEKVMIQAFRNWQLLNQGSAMEDSIARPTLLGLKRDRGGREVRIMTSERARSIL